MNPNSLVYHPLLGPQMWYEARPGRTLGHEARRAAVASAGGRLLGEMQSPQDQQACLLGAAQAWPGLRLLLKKRQKHLGVPGARVICQAAGGTS